MENSYPSLTFQTGSTRTLVAMPEDEPTPLPLFERAISRRALLGGAALLGVALTVPTVACGSSGGDSKAFASTSTTEGPSTTASPGTTTAPSGGGTAAAIPAGATVTTDFTYAVSGGGFAKNPYIAVWVQTASGQFVDTVSLWYQSGRGQKYLNDMRAWITASGGKDLSMSSATRNAGSYSVVWDGNDASGARAPQGDYVICIECAREKGPYQEITVPISIASGPSSANGADKGELSKVSVTYAP